MTPGRFVSILRAFRAAAACAVLTLSVTCANAAAAVWQLQPAPALALGHGDLESVSCPSASTCIAVGYTFSDDPDIRFPVAASWDGARWSVQPSPTPRHGAMYAVSCTSGTECTAVGSFDTGGGGTFPLIERWNGDSWRLQKARRPNGDDFSLRGVSCVSASSCTAVGSDDDVPALLAERWNGSRWSVERTPEPNVDGGYLDAVSCVSNAACTAVGGFINENNGCPTPLAERWNGRRWSIQPTADLHGCGPVDDGTFTDVDCTSAGTCIATGYYDPAARAYDKTLVERWHARRWSIMSTPDVRYLRDPWGGGGGLFGVSCPPGSPCITVGGVATTEVTAPLAERQGPAGWSVLQTPAAPSDGVLFAVSCTPATVCMAVGYDDSLGTDSDVPLVERLP